MEGYDKVVESQEKIREKSTNIWEPTLTPPLPPVPLEWPLVSNVQTGTVVRFINELHEMILDLNLRIQDLEEDRD